MITVPLGSAVSSRTSSMASSVLRRMVRACSWKMRPASVSVTPRAVRRNRLNFSSSSRRSNCWLSEGWASPSDSAARLIEPVSAIFRKLLRCFVSTRVPPEILPMACYNALGRTASRLTRHECHELVIGLLRAGAGDLVLAAFRLGEAADRFSGARPVPAAGAVIFPMDGRLVTRDEAAPIAGRDGVHQHQLAARNTL